MEEEAHCHHHRQEEAHCRHHRQEAALHHSQEEANCRPEVLVHRPEVLAQETRVIKADFQVEAKPVDNFQAKESLTVISQAAVLAIKADSAAKEDQVKEAKMDSVKAKAKMDSPAKVVHHPEVLVHHPEVLVHHPEVLVHHHLLISEKVKEETKNSKHFRRSKLLKLKNNLLL